MYMEVSYCVKAYVIYFACKLPRVSRNTALAPKIGIFWILKQDCFCRTFSQCAIGWFSRISWTDWRHTDSQQCSEPQPQTAPAKATGGQQDYHFEVPLLSVLLVLASQALTDRTHRFDTFLGTSSESNRQLLRKNRSF